MTKAFTADFGKTAGDYARHRAGFPPALVARLKPFGVGLPGQRIVDVGTGTGSLARLLALEGCTVAGIDPSSEMMEKARLLDEAFGVSIQYHVGRAEALPVPEHSQDVVTAGQCWHWFDRAVAASEALRVLRPGGTIVIAHFDWLPLPGNMVEATEALILRYNPNWPMSGGTGFYPQWLGDLSGAGFIAPETFSFDVSVPYSHEDWRGRIRASAGVSGSLDPEGVAAFDADHAALLSERFPADVLEVPHRVWAVIARKPSV